MNKGRYKNLFGNMALFTIGNFVSKLLVMLLVPLYTSVLTTGEYGVADGMQTTLLLLVPLFTINIGEAALRYGIERKGQRDSVLRVMLKYTFFADALVVALCTAGYFVCRLAGVILPTSIALNSAGGLSPQYYFFFFEGLFICNSLYEGMILYCQGCEQVKIMILGSIACTVLLISSNIVFLLVVKIGLAGYLLSQMIAFGGAAGIMLLLMKIAVAAETAGQPAEAAEQPADAAESGEPAMAAAAGDSAEAAEVQRTVTVKLSAQEEASENTLEEEMTRFGRSMLLYSTSSWVNNAIDRYFIIAMCGAAANGLYAVAYKIPAILMVFQRIFAQAWQISANKTYSDEDAADFFSGVYEGYQCVMTLGCSFLIAAVRLIAGLLFAGEFYEAWMLVPPLLISVVFGALTGFLGSVCLAFKDGRSMGRATGTGAVVNMILNYILIRRMGPMGAAFATMISYYIMYTLAYFAAGRHISFKVKRVRDAIAYILLILQFMLMSGGAENGQLLSIACFFILLAMYLKSFIAVIKDRFIRTDK